jgi:hypoxanthine phosphoribosyltransferase
MREDIKEVLYSEEMISEKIKEMARNISEDYKNKDFLVVGILKGAVLFAADLIKNITVHCNIDFMVVSSYGNSTKSSGKVTILKDLDYDVRGKNILIVEDIVDSGLTLDFLVNYFKERGVNSVEIATLLSKPSRRKVEVDVKYIGFEVPNEFLVGFGVDYAERYRNLPFIGTLKPEIYEK